MAGGVELTVGFPSGGAELSIINDELTVNFPLKAGDLDGLSRVRTLNIANAQCGDWSNPEFVEGRLRGFNRYARVNMVYHWSVEYTGRDSEYPGAVESYRLAMVNLIYPHTSHRGDGLPRYRNLDDLLNAPGYLRDEYGEGGWTPRGTGGVDRPVV